MFHQVDFEIDQAPRAGAHQQPASLCVSVGGIDEIAEGSARQPMSVRIVASLLQLARPALTNY
jgi:hypothetical protein